MDVTHPPKTKLQTISIGAKKLAISVIIKPHNVVKMITRLRSMRSDSQPVNKGMVAQPTMNEAMKNDISGRDKPKNFA